MRVLGESIHTLDDLRILTGYKFDEFVPFTIATRERAILNDGWKIPKLPGIYAYWVKINGIWIMTYLGKCESNIRGIRKRIQNELLPSQSNCGPKKVHNKLYELGIDFKCAVSYLVLNEAGKAEAKILSLVDFIGNDVDNGGTRLSALKKFAGDELPLEFDYRILAEEESLLEFDYRIRKEYPQWFDSQGNFIA
jgi:hypothetical protein